MDTNRFIGSAGWCRIDSFYDRNSRADEPVFDIDDDWTLLPDLDNFQVQGKALNLLSSSLPGIFGARVLWHDILRIKQGGYTRSSFHHAPDWCAGRWPYCGRLFYARGTGKL